MAAAFAVLAITWLGLMRRLASWIPAPLVLGLLSGAILPFVSDVFTFLGQAPLMVGATGLAYLLGRRFLEPRVPAILAALVAGLAAAALTGQLGAAPVRWTLPIPTLTAPVFTLHALLTAGLKKHGL
jgi:benzoate membrane transport protein